MSTSIPTIATSQQSILTQVPTSLRFLAKVIFGSLLIAIAAQIAVPFWPVPMTLQTTAIMAIGLVASPSVAVGSAVAYVIEGALGLPVFSGFSSGISTILGTTGGYIIGFIPMIHIISSLKDKSIGLAYRFGICLLGQGMLYIIGVSYLSLFVGVSGAIQLGLLPFIIKIPASILFSIFGIDVLKAIKRT
jgi:biotin transport system substrate-specific component